MAIISVCLFSEMWMREAKARGRAEAVLWAIVYASDQCCGHQHCDHSMEPWQRARELLGLARIDALDTRAEAQKG